MKCSEKKIGFREYTEIIAALRDGEKGCPWDRAQTHESLKPCMIHETAEALAAVDILKETGDGTNLLEELGDVLLQVMLQSQIASEEGLFSIEDVVDQAARKMLRRHPHVFGGEQKTWDEIKRMEKQGRSEEELRFQKEAVRRASLETAEFLLRENSGSDRQG